MLFPILFFWQAIFAIMSTTPHVRLSEDIMSKAIVKFYTDASLVPIGVAVQAVEGVAAKMAYALAKLVRHFRVLYSSAPEKGKNKALTALKQRLQDAQVPASAGTVKRKATAEDLDDVAGASTGLDWKQLAAKIRESEKGKAGSPQLVEHASKRPVATPARAALPPFVLESLKVQTRAKHVKPFATAGGDDAEDEVAEPKSAGEEGAKKSCKVGKRDGKREALVVEAHLAGRSTALVAVPDGMEAPAKLYKPKDFSKMRLDFIANARQEDKLTYKQANEKWMLSSVRADYLAMLPEKELKRRRFL